MRRVSWLVVGVALLGWAGEASANLGGLGRLAGGVGRGAGHAGAHVGGRVAGEVAARTIPDQIGRVCGIIAVVAFLLAGVFFAALFARDLYRKDLSAWVFETRVGTALIPVVILLFCYLGPGVLLWLVFFPEYGFLHWLVVATAPLLVYTCLVAWLFATRWRFTGGRDPLKRSATRGVAVVLSAATVWYLAGPWPRWRLDAAVGGTIDYAEGYSSEQPLLALDILDEAIKDYPGRADVVAARNGVFEKWLEQCQKKQLDSFEAMRPEFWRALAVLDRCIEAGYGGAKPFSERAELHIAIEDYRRAAADATEATRLEPGDAEHWSRLGRAGLGLADYPRAVSAFQEALRLQTTRTGKPGTPGYWYPELQLAASYSRAGWHAEADRVYSDILATDPNCARALLDRGHSRRDSGDYAGALADYRSYDLADPDPSMRGCWQAWALITCPDPAVRDAPQGLALAHRIADGLAARPVPIDAIKKNADSFERCVVLLVLAAGHAQSGKPDDAKDAFERARRYLPTPKGSRSAPWGWEKRPGQMAERRAARNAGDWDRALYLSEVLLDISVLVEVVELRGYWDPHFDGLGEAVRAGKPYFVYPVAPPPRPSP